MTKAIIFDMDGVLVDTESWFQTQFREMLKACGTEVSQEELRVLTGCSMEQEDAFIQEKLGMDAYTAARTKDTWLQAHPVNYAAQARPGLKETLECLKEAGFKVAVASSSPMRFIRQMIQECGLEGLFDVVVSGHDLPKTKPDPAIYRLALQQLGIPALDAAAVEDSFYGVQAAKGAGLFVFGFHDPFSNLSLVEADTVVDDLTQVPAFFNLVPQTCRP